MLPIFIKLFNSLQTIKLGVPIVKVLHSEFSRKNDGEFNQIDTSINEMSFKKDIKFQNIEFKYPNKDDSILENIDLKFEQGKIIGIIGSTGSGKTTFLNLLTGLIKPTKGKIFCDSVDINEQSINWRKK